MKYKAIIFDLDGTLLNTLADIGKSVNQVLSQHGLPENSIDDYMLFVGDGTKNLIRRATLAKVDEKTLELMVKEFIEIYAQNCNQTTQKYAGIDSLLNFCDSKKVPYAVLSNKPHEITKKMVDFYFPHQSFVSVFGQQSGVPIKPNPIIAKKIISLFKCEPQMVAFLGDSGVDMETAITAGAIPIGVLWGYRERDELLEHGANILIEHPMDMKILL